MISNSSLSPAQLVALAFGCVYLMVGLVGFAVTGFDQWASQVFFEKLLIFPLNPLHNIVHIALGLIWMFSSSRLATAKQVNLVLGVVLVVVAVAGVAGILKFLAIEDGVAADNILHVVTGAVSIYFGTIGAGHRSYAH
jgi:hypothetical protein